jgi:hypothetical protein
MNRSRLSPLVTATDSRLRLANAADADHVSGLLRQLAAVEWDFVPPERDANVAAYAVVLVGLDRGLEQGTGEEHYALPSGKSDRSRRLVRKAVSAFGHHLAEIAQAR